MGHEPKAEFATARKDPGEFLRRVSQLAGGQTDAQYLVAVRQHLLQRLERLLLAEVAQKAEYQRGGDAELLPRRNTGAVQAIDHHGRLESMAGVGLGVKEDLGMHHVVGMGTGKIGARHVEEILLGAQHHGAGVVDVEETLQVVKNVGLPKRLHTGIRQSDAIAPCQREDHFGLQ